MLSKHYLEEEKEEEEGEEEEEEKITKLCVWLWSLLEIAKKESYGHDKAYSPHLPVIVKYFVYSAIYTLFLKENWWLNNSMTDIDKVIDIRVERIIFI